MFAGVLLVALGLVLLAGSVLAVSQCAPLAAHATVIGPVPPQPLHFVVAEIAAPIARWCSDGVWVPGAIAQATKYVLLCGVGLGLLLPGAGVWVLASRWAGEAA